MSCGLAKQFEVYARCCLKLAEEAGTRELRDRLLQMAQEFMSASRRTAPETAPLRNGDPPGAPAPSRQLRIGSRDGTVTLIEKSWTKGPWP